MTLERILHDLEEVGLEVLDTRHTVSLDWELLLAVDSLQLNVYLRLMTDYSFGGSGEFIGALEVFKDGYEPIIGRNYIWSEKGLSDMSVELTYEGLITYMPVKVGTIKTQFGISEWPTVLHALKKMCH